MRFAPWPPSRTRRASPNSASCSAGGEIGHRAAQLAAWHLSNGMSWEKLAGLRTKQAIGTIPSYTKDEIAAAKKAVEKAVALHKQRQEAAKPTSAAAAK